MDPFTAPMTPLTSDAIERAFLDAALDPLPDHAYLQIASFLEILERWNARMNLTSVRCPEDVLQRHVIECVVAARELPADIESLLDYGSGAGFPGLIFALCRPTIRVTLAEAHAKK